MNGNWKTVSTSRPILFDFDISRMISIYAEIFPLMQRFGYTGNLFIKTGVYDALEQHSAISAGASLYASWEQLAELVQAGWTIGAHTHIPGFI